MTSLSNPASKEITITTFPHPQPDLIGVQKELVQYKRKDGIELTANLYLPPDYDGTPRPTLFWAYPREFKNSKAAGQIKGSKHRFVSASWASPVHWATKGWCIMDDFSLPVIGEGDAHPNDTFIDQIVAGAMAAVEYAKKRGVCDPTRCAVGGHSYGSFMTAHLLSHTSLFAAGIGRSGAFNRTLTPMSFRKYSEFIVLVFCQHFIIFKLIRLFHTSLLSLSLKHHHRIGGAKYLGSPRYIYHNESLNARQETFRTGKCRENATDTWTS
jgi:dipeptidyl aminopeptidase/acylaminoacyl peptidase